MAGFEVTRMAGFALTPEEELKHRRFANRRIAFASPWIAQDRRGGNLHISSTDFHKDSVRIRLTMFHDTIIFTPD
jgi:hypothetical protein